MSAPMTTPSRPMPPDPLSLATIVLLCLSRICLACVTCLHPAGRRTPETAARCRSLGIKKRCAHHQDCISRSRRPDSENGDDDEQGLYPSPLAPLGFYSLQTTASCFVASSRVT